MVKKRLNRKTIFPYLLIAPIFILLIMFSAWPLATAFIKSLYRYDALRINEFIGLDNYITLLFHDAAFWKSMKNLLVLFVGMNVAFCFPVIAAKLVCNVKGKKIQYIMRLVFITPMVVPSVVTMMLWKFIYYPQIGVIARICNYFNITAPKLLGTPSTALIAVILIGFPWVSGLNFLVARAALQGIDNSVIEAAELDGAGKFKQFIKIELPMIKPQLKALYILAFIGQFQDYERFLILTNGGPKNSTLVPGLHMYHAAFPGSGEAEYGYACAIAVVLFVMTIVLSKLLLRNKEDN